MSLVEVLLATAVLVGVLVATMLVAVNFHESAVLGRHRVTAIQDAQAIIVQMRNLVSQGTSVPEGLVEAFPEGALEIETAALPGESIFISYEDPTQAPLFVTVNVQWRYMRGRVVDESVSTAIGDT